MSFFSRTSALHDEGGSGYLPQNKIAADDILDGGVAPHVAGQRLAGKDIGLLDVDKQPFAVRLALFLGLRPQQKLSGGGGEPVRPAHTSSKLPGKSRSAGGANSLARPAWRRAGPVCRDTVNTGRFEQNHAPTVLMRVAALLGHKVAERLKGRGRAALLLAVKAGGEHCQSTPQTALGHDKITKINK
jgi:hypothetical protein